MLNQLVSSEKNQEEVRKDKPINNDSEEAYTPEEEEALKKRLKDLGYL